MFVILSERARATRTASGRIYAFLRHVLTLSNRKNQIDGSIESSSSRVAGLGLVQDDNWRAASHSHSLLTALAYCAALLGSIIVFPSPALAHVNSPDVYFD